MNAFLLFIRKLLARLGIGLVLCNPFNLTYFCSGLKLKQQIKALTILTRKKKLYAWLLPVRAG